MAPPRQRTTTAIVDDSRSEASSGTREYKSTASKSRKAGTGKEKVSVASVPVGHDQHTEYQPRLLWSDFPLDILHAYRHAHKLSTPSAFSNDYSRIILSQGIGQRSPTSLAARPAQSSTSHSNNNDNNNNDNPHDDPSSTSTAIFNSNPRNGRDGETSLHRIIGQGRVSKDQFALAVRKHFNSAGLSEQESIARFLYTVREERRGRQFRLRFQP